MAIIHKLCELATPESEHLVVSLAIWATVILSLTWMAVAAARRASPAVRYCLWQFALAGLLAVPLVFACLPGVPLGLSLPAAQKPVDPAVVPDELMKVATFVSATRSFHRPEIETAPAERIILDQPLAVAELPDSPQIDQAQETTLVDDVAVDELPVVDVPAAVPASPRARPWSISQAVWAVWATGATLQGLWLVYATLLVRRLLGSGRLVRETRFQRVLDELRRLSGYSRPVRLLQCDRVQSPLVVGALRPAILLPNQCSQWTSERIAMVLSHELAHIQRRDLLWQLLARLSAAIYWFHPLTWLAVRRMRLERERACDDRVLLAGIEPTDYAAGLVECAVALRGRPLNLTLGISMAQPSQLETRIRSILDGSLARTPVSAGVRRAIVGASAALVLTLGLLRPFSPVVSKAAEPPAATENEVAASIPEPAKPATATSDSTTPATEKPAPAPAPAPAAEPPATNTAPAGALPPAASASATTVPVTGEVWMSRFTPDNKFLVICGGGEWNNYEPGWVKIWNWETKQEVYSEAGPRGIINASLSPDGARLALSKWTDTAVLRELGGKQLTEVKMQRYPRTAFSPDGKLLAVSDEHKKFRLLDALTGKDLPVFEGDRPQCFVIQFSPDGSLLGMSGGAGHKPEQLTSTQISVWDVATGKQIFKAADHPNRVYVSALSPDNKTFAAACDDSVWLWDLTSGMLRDQIKTPHGFIHGMSYSPDGSMLATAGSDDVVVWDTGSWQQKQVLAGHKSCVRGLSFTRDNKTLVTAGSDQRILIWDLATGAKTGVLNSPAEQPDAGSATLAMADQAGPSGPLSIGSTVFVKSANAPIADSPGEIYSCHLSGNGKFLVASGGGEWMNRGPGWCRIWDLETKKKIASYENKNGIFCSSLSPDGRRIAYSSWDSRMVLEEVGGRGISKLTTKRHPRVAFSPDGYLLVVADERYDMQVLDGLTGRQLDGFKGDKMECIWMGFSADGSLLGMSGGAWNQADREKTPQLAVWDVASRRQIFKTSGLPNRVYVSALSPDNKTFAAGCDQTIWLYDIESGTLRDQIKTPHGFLRGLQYSPDGSILASSGGDDGVIVLWDTKSWEPKGRLEGGHTLRVRGLSFTKDGKTLASAGTDQAIRLWDVDKQTVKDTIQQPVISSNTETPRFLAVAYSPNGQTVAAAGEDGRVSVYDLKTGKPAQSWEAHGDAVAALAWSPDGKTLASGGYDKIIQLWDPATGQSLRKLQGHKGWVVSLAFSSDGQTLASGSYDRSIVLWNPADGTERKRLEGHTATVRTLAYSPDGNLLASGSADRKVKLWNLATGQEQASLEGHEGAIRGISFSPDGKRLASGGEDRLVKLWNVAEHKLERTLTGHSDMISAAVFAGPTLVSASWDHSLRTWDIETGEGLSKFDAGGDAVIALSVAPSGRELLSACANGTFRVWNAAQGGGRPTAAFGPYGNPMYASFSPDGSLVAIAANRSGETCDLYLIDRANSAERFHVELPGFVRKLAYSPLGNVLALGVVPGRLLLVDASNASMLGTLGEEGEGVSGLAFSPDGKLLAVDAPDKTVRIYDVERRELTTTLKGHKDVVVDLAFSPDQTSLLSACKDHTSMVWDLSSGERRFVLPRSLSEMRVVAWSPDGKTLATGNQSGECKLWNAVSGRAQRTLKVTDSELLDLGFSPDSRQLAVATGDNLVRLFDVASGSSLFTYSAHLAPVRSARFSPDGKSLLTAGDDGWAKIWPRAGAK